MESAEVDENLRAQSKALLQKLKARQSRLQNIIIKTPEHDFGGQSHEIQPLNTSVTGSKLGHFRNGDVLEAREKLSNFARQVLESEGEQNLGLDRRKQAKDDVNMTYQKDSLKDKDVDTCPDETYRKGADFNKEKTPERRGDTTTETPNTVRRRRIIDRNVRVDSELDNSTFMNGYENESHKLNYSYSRFDESDLNFLQSRFNGDSPEEIFLKDSDQPVETDQDESVQVTDSMPDKGRFAGRLQDPGNNRQYANFIRDTTTKPKSILLSTGPKSRNKSNAKVSFQASRDRTSMSLASRQEQPLLGYDWIAGLLDNESGTMDQSEAFFEDLRSFRRVNRDECVNHAYMEGPENLLELRDKEPSPVAKALEESKVKPFTVNDRLFTVPLKKRLLPEFRDYEQEEEKSAKEPTAEDPRFVRVSIPRSTLLSPHRVKPHRRKSFDPTDSCSLSEHCLLGWDTSRPSMMPPASNVGLRDASLGIKSTLTTTLADAEKIAANYPYPWSGAERPARPVQRSSAYQSYLDSTVSTLPYSMRVDASTSQLGNDTQASLKRATDDLLDSTYSLMYEMEKIRKQRDQCVTMGQVS